GTRRRGRRTAGLISTSSNTKTVAGARPPGPGFSERGGDAEGLDSYRASRRLAGRAAARRGLLRRPHQVARSTNCARRGPPRGDRKVAAEHGGGRGTAAAQGQRANRAGAFGQ